MASSSRPHPKEKKRISFQDETASQHVNTVEDVFQMLKSSRWRMLAGMAGFFQVIFFLVMGLLLFYAACMEMQNRTSEYPYNELLPTNTGTSKNLPQVFQEVISNLSAGKTLGEQKITGWRTLCCVAILNAVFSIIQSWRGSQLLTACWKFQDLLNAWTLLNSWRRGIINYRNYVCGFVLSTLIFATDPSGTPIVALAGYVLIAIALITVAVVGYWMQIQNLLFPKVKPEMIV